MLSSFQALLEREHLLFWVLVCSFVPRLYGVYKEGVFIVSGYVKGLYPGMLDHLKVSALGKSNHSTMKVILNCTPIHEPIRKTFYKYDKGDYPKMEDMLSIDWDARIFLNMRGICKPNGTYLL